MRVAAEYFQPKESMRVAAEYFLFDPVFELKKMNQDLTQLPVDAPETSRWYDGITEKHFDIAIVLAKRDAHDALITTELARIITRVRTQATNDALERAAIFFEKEQAALSGDRIVPSRIAADLREMKVPT